DTCTAFRDENILDSGSTWYYVYETKDGQYVAIGSIEGRFYRELLRLTGLEGEPLPDQRDRTRWPELRARLASAFRQRTREEWCTAMEGSDVCFAPVLSLTEAPQHPHNRARSTFGEPEAAPQRAPAPRFSRSKPTVARPPAARPGEHSEEVLADWGYSAAEVQALIDSGAVSGGRR